MRPAVDRHPGRKAAGAARRMVLAALCALAFTGAALAGPEELPRRAKEGVPRVARFKPITIFVVRHAEKGSEGGSDPDLSEAGRARAQMLAAMLGSAGVTRLLASPYKRTKQTLEPLSAATGVPVEVIEKGDPGAASEAIHVMPPGSVVVFAGHSNTVPELIRRLGGQVTGLVKTEQHGEILDDAQYDRIFQVLLPPIGRLSQSMEPALVELKYPPLPEVSSAGGAEPPVEVEGGADHR